MNILSNKIQNSIIILCSLLCAIIFFNLFGFLRFNEADTPNFINAARILFGATDLIDCQSRITKPFVLLFPGFLYTYFGISITVTMLIQNLIFFVGTGFFTAKILQYWGFDFTLQLLGVFIIYTVQPLAVLSFMLINDIAGYFFTTFLLYYYLQTKVQTLEQCVVFSLIGIVGVLSKESSALALIVVLLYMLMYHSKQWIRLVVTYAAITIAYMGVQWYIQHTFGYVSSIENLTQKYEEPEGYIFKIQQLIHSFDVYWIYIIVGVLYIILRKSPYSFFVWATIVSIPFLFLWPSVQDRTIAVAAPIFVWVIISFLQQSTWLHKGLLIVGGISNIVCTYIIYAYKTSNVLPVYYTIFFVLFALLYKEKIKQII